MQAKDTVWFKQLEQAAANRPTELEQAVAQCRANLARLPGYCGELECVDLSTDTKRSTV